MNNDRNRLYAAAFSAMLAGFAGPVFAANADLETQVDAASQPLQGIVVTGSSNALLSSDQRLALLNAALPLDTGSSGAQPGGFQRVLALFPESPNTATGEARRMMERTSAPVSAGYMQ